MSAQSSSTQRDRIFISYRRDDARGASGRIYDWLRIGFGRERVFRDVHSIGVGRWRDKIDAALAKSAACVAVIGTRWANPDNLPRLHDPDDMVRHELVSALACADITLVPTLVEGAAIPRLADLPAELHSLFSVWNARPISEGGWEDDIRRLIAEIADATHLPVGPDLDTLLHDVAAARQRVAELEQARHHDAEQIESLRRTIDDLTARLAGATAGERPGLANAFAELARGNTLAAEDAFEREYAAQVRLADQARRNQAEAARNVANLALLRDVAKAADYYRKALDAEPEHASTLLQLGYALIASGQLDQAQRELARSLVSARESGDLRVEAAAQIGQGDVLKRHGKLADALRAYAKGLRLCKQRMTAEPESALWRCGLALGYDRFGDVLLDQGRGPLALAAFRKGLVVREALTAAEPRNAQLQRDVTVSLDSIARVLLASRDRSGALDALRRGLSTRLALVSRNPGNSHLQRDLSLSHNRIGDALLNGDDREAALDAYRRGFAIAEALAALDPANTEWQRDLSVSYEKLGDAQSELGNRSEALDAFGSCLGIRENLVAHDRNNAQWQHDLSIIHAKVGDELQAHGDGPGALTAYRKSLAIAEAVTARNPTNIEWQRNLAVCHNRIGDMLLAQRDLPGTLAHYRESLEIAEALTKRDRTNAEWQRDLIVSLGKLSALTGDRTCAARALEIAKSMQARGILAPRDAWMIDELKRWAGE